MNENNLSYNNNENPTNKLYDHFKKLYSAPDISGASALARQRSSIAKEIW